MLPLRLCALELGHGHDQRFIRDCFFARDSETTM